MQFIQMEYELMKPEWPLPWETLYFGGGTPSLLPAEQLATFITHVKLNGGIQPDAEITLEANPEDVNQKNIEKWKLAGINRISLGVQSLSDVELQAMNRAHTAANSVSALKMLTGAGFNSVNLDLIYGSQWLSDDAWKETLQWAFNCGAQHISAYALTAEPNTRLQKEIDHGKVPPMDDDKQAKHFELLQEYADKYDWLHYETSNLCLPGFEAKHNSNYWENKPYLGLGPSAHSFDGKRTRRWNIADNHAYVLGLENQQLNFEEELLSDNDYINELIITRLRLTKGLDTNLISIINPHWHQLKVQIILEMSVKNLILTDNNWITLTSTGRLLSDAISRELMV